MLKKLLKYDLIKMLKILSIFYILSVVFAFIARGFNELSADYSIFKILYIIFSSIEYGLLGNVLVNTFIRILVRFVQNFYKDESYLTHTLPVSKKNLLLSKIIAGVIVTISSIVVFVLSLMIMFYTPEAAEGIKAFFLSSFSQFNLSISTVIIFGSLMVFSQIFAIMMMSYTSVIIGYRSNEKKALISLLWVLIFYFAGQAFSVAVLFIIGLFSGEFMMLFTQNIISFNMIKIIVITSILQYLVFSFVLYLIGKKVLEKGVNVD